MSECSIEIESTSARSALQPLFLGDTHMVI
jgi:hypothetical protein